MPPPPYEKKRGWPKWNTEASKKFFGLFIYILDMMERAKKPSRATVSLRKENVKILAFPAIDNSLDALSSSTGHTYVKF